MPRKSVDKGSVEKPATRKSIEPAKPDLKADVKASPEKRGRGRPKKNYDESIEDEEMEIGTAEAPVEEKSPAKGKRGRKPKAEIASEKVVDEEEAKVEDAKQSSSKSKSRATRNQTAPAKAAEDVTPRRKSERGAAKAAELRIAQVNRADGDHEDADESDEEDDESASVASPKKVDRKKRKADDDGDNAVAAPAPKKRGRPSAASKADAVAENSNVAASTDASKVNNEGDKPSSANTASDADAELPLNDFVVVERHDVPAADSDEVKLALKSVEDHAAAKTHNATGATTASSPAVSDKTATVISDNRGSSSEMPPGSPHNETPLNGSLFGRQFVANARASVNSAPEQRFTLVSYNILADCHAQRSPYAWTPRECLAQEFRHKLLLEELDFLQTDIVCLQEVGTAYFPTLQEALQSKGYSGLFQRREGEYHDEGEATFFRSSRFTLVESLSCSLGEITKQEVQFRAEGLDDWAKQSITEAVSDPGVVLITRLRAEDGACVTVANTHLVWKAEGKHDVHCVQVAQLISRLIALAGGSDKPFILCGDFNSTPDTPVYQVTRDGYPSDSSLSHLQELKTIKSPQGEELSMVNLWWDGFKHTANSLNSAYFTCLDHEPMSSVYPHNAAVLPVDYIWYSDKGLQLDGVLSPVNEQVIRAGIPSKHLPSDHVSLKATFSFT